MQIYLFTKIMNAKIYPEWKWSNGIPYEKSNRIKPCETIQEEQPKKEVSVNNALCDSLNYQTQSYGETLFSRNDTGNRREETYSKMAERKMTNQINQNPFLLHSDYVNDLMTQDKYMKPINTTFEKVKKPE
jgi:hypothetical protein